MKFQLHSDLHLERAQFPLRNMGADTLILAGDICVAKGFNHWKTGARFKEFFDVACSQFEYVIYIMGNHEHYGGDIQTTIAVLRDNLRYPNLYILDNEVVEISGITIVGSTLWTDVLSKGPIVELDVKATMNDYQVIRNSANQVRYRVRDNYRLPEDRVSALNDLLRSKGIVTNFIEERSDVAVIDGSGKVVPVRFKVKPGKLTPKDTSEMHRSSVEFIKQSVDGKARCVVVTHQAPCSMSVPEKWKMHKATSAYYEDLSDLILDRPQIEVWCHGHIHTASNYQLGSTKVLAEPRGYVGVEIKATDFSCQMFEV